MNVLRAAARWATHVLREVATHVPRPASPPSAPRGPVDSYTPAPGGGERRPHLSPPQRPEGYSRPVSASRLPEPEGGTGVLTLNLANGAGDEYRTPENRKRQAELIRTAGASLVGFQEVDVGVDRTRNVHTTLDVVRHLEPAFGAFLSGAQVPTVDMAAQAPETAIRRGGDGTTVYQTPRGALVTGESFSGDDRAIHGDRGADATYGNALYVGAPNRLVEAYTVVLPASPGADAQAGATPEQLATLADGTLSGEERAELGRRNEELRKHAPTEPRTALVARVVGPDGRERTVINTHLAMNGDKALRARQLDSLAQLVQAESKGPPAREVVVMGDFNSSTAEVGAALQDVGMRRVVGGHKASGANYDQVWVSGGLDTDTSAQVRTDDVSDHRYAGYTVLR